MRVAGSVGVWSSMGGQRGGSVCSQLPMPEAWEATGDITNWETRPTLPLISPLGIE